VRKITFTGSGASARRSCATRRQALSGNAGARGKSPNIILPDADLDLVVPGIVTGMRFTRQGQSCSAGTRLFIHDDVYDEVVARSIDAMRALRIGLPMRRGDADRGDHLARAVRARHGYVALAPQIRRARRSCAAAARPADPALQRGYFYEPTLIEGAPPDSRLPGRDLRPGATCERWNDYERMLREANGTPYRSRRRDLDRDLARAMDLVSGGQPGSSRSTSSSRRARRSRTAGSR
jgi:acyl-CoA reductase-like NAD-dependent aldehyde dehydrogenase